VGIALRDALVRWTEAIPEPDEGSRKFCCSWAAYSQMRVTPLGVILTLRQTHFFTRRWYSHDR
jgi:hypothetical protein